MSADVTAWLDGLEAAHKAAWDEVTGLCDGSRRWTMRVPVDEARDSDTVIAAALNGSEQLLAVVRGVLALTNEADDRVRASVPVSAADILIAGGDHTVKVRDLRAVITGGAS